MPPPSRSRSRSIQNAVIAVALFAEFIALIGHPLFGWGTKFYAATPRPLIYTAPQPPAGQDVLLSLAAVAARQPALVATGRTPYAYVKREGWRLASRPAVSSKVLPTVTESWLMSDGAGRIVSVTRKTAGSTVVDAAVPAGHSVPALPADEAALARRLGWGNPTTTPPAREFVVITDLADGQPVSPPTDAALLRLLAHLPGLINSGTVIDRDGRPGVAVSLNSAYSGVLTRYTLIFDRATGRLLESDQTLIGDPNSLDVQTGSILAYTTFLASGYVAGTTARP